MRSDWIDHRETASGLKARFGVNDGELLVALARVQLRLFAETACRLALGPGANPAIVGDTADGFIDELQPALHKLLADHR